MKHLLVTGGCGFIGSNFIRQFLNTNADWRISNLDSLTYAGNLENLTELTGNPRYRFHRVDCCDAKAVNGVFDADAVDAVVHFAAESHVDRSILDPGQFLLTNVMGTQVLLEASRQHQVKKYVQVSTDEVYGSLGLQGAFTEETPLAPNSPYSASKAGGDLLVRAYCHTYGFPAVITRCSNNYGPYQFPEKLLPLFIANAEQDQQLPVYGQGQNVRDWIHVEDHCRGVAAALHQGKVGEVYNFGGGCEMKNIDLTQLLLKLLGKPETLIRYVADRPGHDLRYAIDFSKATRELGWKPQVTFSEGLAETIKWYRAHADWMARIRSGEYRNYYERQYASRLDTTNGGSVK